LSLCLTDWALCHEGVWGSGCIDPYFLDLGTSWRWVVSFTPLLLYPWGESPPPGIHWLGGLVDPRAGLVDVEERKFLTLPRLELRPLGRPACSQSLYRFCYPGTSLYQYMNKKLMNEQFLSHSGGLLSWCLLILVVLQESCTLSSFCWWHLNWKYLCGHLLAFYNAREIICISNSLLKGSVFRYPECYTVMLNILDLFHPQAFVACVWYVTLAFVALNQDSPFYSRLCGNYRDSDIMLVEIQVESLISLFFLRFTSSVFATK
jgi:hypothetical protein